MHFYIVSQLFFIDEMHLYPLKALIINKNAKQKKGSYYKYFHLFFIKNESTQANLQNLTRIYLLKKHFNLLILYTYMVAPQLSIRICKLALILRFKTPH